MSSAMRRPQSSPRLQSGHRRTLWLEDGIDRSSIFDEFSTSDLTEIHTCDDQEHSPRFKRLSDAACVQNEHPLSTLMRNIRVRSISREGRSRRNHAYDDKDIDPVTGSPREHIEMTHVGGFVLRSKVVDQGHKFIAVILKSPTWCDLCGLPVLGVIRRFLVCRQCSFTCHQDCRKRVSVFCPQIKDRSGCAAPRSRRASHIVQETSLTYDPNALNESDPVGVANERDLLVGVANERELSVGVVNEKKLSHSQLEEKINAFNCNNHGLVIELSPTSNEFAGFVRVYINLFRPITMCVSAKPPSSLDVTSPTGCSGTVSCLPANVRDSTGELVPAPCFQYTRVTSFYLPPNTSKTVHISDTTTAQELIALLLAKFKITDNPRKFALYESLSTVCSETGLRTNGVHNVGSNTNDSSEPRLRRLGDDELPLVLSLHWTCSHGLIGLNSNRFLLQENDSTDIRWDMFSVPELEMFLLILRREEEEYLERLHAKYTRQRFHLNRQLCEMENRPALNGAFARRGRDRKARVIGVDGAASVL